MSLLDRFLGTIEKYRMVSPGDHVLVAVSGGPDSVALLFLFRTAVERLGVRLSVAHLNHRLRGAESDADEAFVRALAERHRLPIACRRLRPGALSGPGSLEEKARAARYRFLATARRRAGADRVAVGHHRDDQAETFLMRLLRGSGRTGLGAIHPVRDGWLIRPLIEAPRDEIAGFLRRRRIAWREDRSNLDRRHLRNRIRLELLPVLARYNPKIVPLLAATADRLRDEDLLLDRIARQLLAGSTDPARPGHLPVDLLRGNEPPMRRRLVLAALERAFGDRRRVGSRQVADLLGLLDRDTGGRQATLPGDRRAVRRHDRIELCAAGEKPDPLPLPQVLPLPGCCPLPRPGLELRGRILARERLHDPVGPGGPRRAFLDADLLRPPLVVRGRRPGDRFRPLGGPGSRKIQDFFVDRRVPLEQRDGWPLVTSGDDILWVVGCQIDDRFRVRRSTRNVLVLEQAPPAAEPFGPPGGESGRRPIGATV